MQSKREVFDNLVRGKPAERVGLVDAPWGDTLVAWIVQGYPTEVVHKEVGEMRWREDGKSVEAEAAGDYVQPVPPWRHFGYDMVGLSPWMDIMPLRDYEQVIEETDAWQITRNGAGAALKYWKHKSGTPEHIAFEMVNRQVWEQKYRPLLLALDPARIKLVENRKAYQEARREGVWTHMGHMFVWELMRQSMGDVTMYESLLLDPAWIHDYCRVYTDFFKLHFRYLFEQIGLPDGVWLFEDLGYKNGLFASPKVLAELIFPYYAELIAFFHSYDLPVVLHSCGSMAQALPLIVEAGFDAVNPMERKAVGNDPLAFAEQYGDRLAFVGGLDTRVLETNDRDIIRQEVSAYIEGMKARGARLVFASDHSISPNTRYESYLYALEVYREHMWY